MNWLCIAILIIWLLIAMNGFRRGLVRTAISMVSFLLIIILVSIISPVVNQVLVERTTILEQVEGQCSQALEGVLQSDEDLNRNDQVSFIEGLEIPSSIKNVLTENNNSVIYDMLSVDTFTEYIAAYLAKAIVQIIAYLIALVLAILILKIVTSILDLFANLPIIGGINRIGGLMLGAIKGLLYLWIFFLIITALGSTDAGTYLLREVASDPILSYFYDNNLIMQFLVSLITR